METYLNLVEQRALTTALAAGLPHDAARAYADARMAQSYQACLDVTCRMPLETVLAGTCAGAA